VRNGPLLVDEHAGAAATNQLGEVGRLHASIIAAPVVGSQTLPFRSSER
jgi:hypothetical protein